MGKSGSFVPELSVFRVNYLGLLPLILFPLRWDYQVLLGKGVQLSNKFGKCRLKWQVSLLKMVEILQNADVPPRRDWKMYFSNLRVHVTFFYSFFGGGKMHIKFTICIVDAFQWCYVHLCCAIIATVIFIALHLAKLKPYPLDSRSPVHPFSPW